MSCVSIYAVNTIRKLCKGTKYKEVARRKKFNGTYDVVFIAGDYLYIVNVDVGRNEQIQRFTLTNVAIVNLGKG